MSWRSEMILALVCTVWVLLVALAFCVVVNKGQRQIENKAKSALTSFSEPI